MQQSDIQRKLTPEERKREGIRKVAEDLRGGRKVVDFRFDQVYPAEIREISNTQWTPVEVAIRASELLVRDSGTKVLDVGSGCGKFCAVGALSSPGWFIGVEERPHLVEIARKAAESLGATKASFILGNMLDLDWTGFDAFYLFNPFFEHKMKAVWIDATISHSQEKFERYVQIVRTKLQSAAPGARVVTYHGFGGDFPPGYQLSHKEPIGTSDLELWTRVE